MAGDDPADVASERFFEAVLGEHPLGRPIGGSPETIRAATRDAVLEHYRANYRPQDLVVTVAGAVDHDALVVELERALGAAGLGPRRRRRPGRTARHRAGATRAAAPRSRVVDAARPSRSTCCSACPASSRPTTAAPR